MSDLSPLTSSAARAALLAGTLLYLLFGFALRSWLVYRRTGVNPFVLPARDDVAGYVGRGFKLVVAGAAAVAMWVAVVPTAVHWLGVFGHAAHGFMAAAGWLLLAGALGLMLVAQAQMGDAWRIGIDERRPTALVQHGVFGRSRNPIFLAMRLLLVGFALLVPTAVTVALAVAGELLIQIQVRLEEAHLSSRHGMAYAAYCARVNRWLGRRRAYAQ
jgi:protein-S-isoprenylcysteine O-methyltransferase Ste14